MEGVARLRNITFRKARGLQETAIPAALLAHQNEALCALLGLRRTELRNNASNLLTMKKLHAAIGEGMLEAWRQIQPRPFWLLTFTPDHWLIDELDPVLGLESARRDSANWLKALGLSGFGMFEFEPFMNHPLARRGLAIALHLHFIGVAAQEATLPKRVRSYNETHRAKCSIGAFVTAKKITAEIGHICKATTYMAKPVFSAKRVTPRRDDDGGYNLRNAPISPQLALRTAEIMSYVAPSQLMITRHSSGWGYKQRIVELAGLRAGLTQPQMLWPDELDRLWRDVWRAAGVDSYQRVQLI